MIALIIGYGSAGVRHLSILKKIKKIKKIYIITKQNVKCSKKIHFLKKIENINPGIIVVANETYKHKKTLIFLEKKFINKTIIIEKPLFDNFYNYKLKNNKIVLVAYNLRFNPILKFIKKKYLKKKYFMLKQRLQATCLIGEKI